MLLRNLSKRNWIPIKYIWIWVKKSCPLAKSDCCPSDKIEIQRVKNQYFYLYYNREGLRTHEEVEIIKEAVKNI